MNQSFELTVNGKRHTIITHPERPLLEVLREDLGLTGTKYGCGEGQCGACSVLLDGERTHSCVLAVSAVAGKSITTIEGLSDGDKLHFVQQAFIEETALQCGFCTSGMILSTVALLNQKRKPTEEDILAWMNPQICRCCGYPRILNAVRRAAASLTDQ